MQQLTTKIQTPKTARRLSYSLLFLTLGIAGVIITGCSLFGANPAPPSKFEQAIFDIQTNRTQVIKTETNYVTVQVPTPVFHTNEVGVTVTNVAIVTQIIPTYLQVTNTHEVYTLTPKAATTDTVAVAGSIGNAVAPGIGGLIAGIAGGILTMWGKLRSSKQVGTTLAQNIQTMREFLKTIPNGAQYDNVLTQFMQQHQAEQGVLQQVLQILPKLNYSGAQVAAQEIQAALTELNTPATPK